MKTKKELYTLLAAIFAGVGAFIFLILSPTTFDVSATNGSYGNSSVTQSFDMSGFEVIFGYSFMGVLKVNEFNFFLFLAMVIAVAVCVMLFLDRFGKLKTDFTVYYIIGLAVSALLVFLSVNLISFSDMIKLALSTGEAQGISFGFSLTIWGVISGLSLAGSAILLAFKKWGLKEEQEVE